MVCRIAGLLKAFQPQIAVLSVKLRKDGKERWEHGPLPRRVRDVSTKRSQGTEAAWTDGRLGDPSLPDAATYAGLSTPPSLTLIH